MSAEFGLVTDDYTYMEDYRRDASYPVRPAAPAPGGGGEAAPLLSPGIPTATSFTQIEHVSIDTPANAQPSLIHIDGKPVDTHRYEFPGFVPPSDLKFEMLDPIDRATLHHPSRGTLNEIYSTAICGNDLTSSVLYVIGVTTTMAGQLAPICLLIVGFVLYLFKSVYGEAGTAIPLNGGAYNLLLNTTSKNMASLAACLTILSYIATAVVSATECMTYAANLCPWIDIYWGTILLLGFFCFLSVMGITESAVVAVGIFIVHMGSMVFLIFVGTLYTFQNPSILANNLKEPLKYDWPLSILFGFCTAMLGVTGFETSANYIEEQQRGVFPKTLFNTWFIVFCLNPLLSIICLGVLDLPTLEAHHRDVLAKTAYDAGGKYFGLWISADAALVLAGAVLTAYVGVTGLVRRLALDRCMPQLLLAENRFRRTNHLIPISFFILCSSLFILLQGRVRSLANVYTLSFLCVMTLFAVGNMMLKYKRGRIRRPIRASWSTNIAALAAVVVALIGNIMLAPGHLIYFFIYFIVVAGITWAMFERIRVLKYFLYFVSQGPQHLQDRFAGVTQLAMDKIRSQKVVFFAKNDNLEVLNKAVSYVQQNELTRWLKVVYVYEDLNDPMIKAIAENLRVIDRCFPKMVIDLVLVQGTFSPEVVAQISSRLGVPRNFMFIACPGDRFPHDIGDFGGVRMITH
uniref:Amino acid permease/ SLC12A domain-containing protein n=1 Tax=Hanusia phi TaxID=3032 RepID=A0A7S0ESQ3_9CRYP|mmetsp:Transcript_31028/g.69846  ORF Transcript_31028/g.69846 Transcript_31028/m.69846 type:complete len:687 (+) Transcript_31028:116-2176(+)